MYCRPSGQLTQLIAARQLYFYVASTALREIIDFAGDKDSSLISQSVSCLIDYLCETDFPPHRWA